MKSVLIKKQVKKFQAEGNVYGEMLNIIVTVRYDDQCNNGHNSFSITGEYRGGGGCIHDIISENFPELRHLIKWHLFDSTGPMHYLANTMYHASDKDCWGLRKGEKRQILKGGVTPMWELMPVDSSGEEVAKLPKTLAQNGKPKGTQTYAYVPWCRTGEGKEPDLEAARSCAVWPDATLEQLCDEEQLKARLPALVAEFKSVVESLGFVY